MQEVEKKLTVKFHGRIIEQLGIQLYQSPVAAIAELVSNCWDAEATSVFITLPDDIAPESYIEIKDNGTGMTFEQCQSRYLNIGYNTRGNNPAQKTPNLKRPVLGRKGIGKLAGFGISQIVSLETISCESGEKTTFSLELDKLLGDGQTYIQENLELDAVGYEGPDEERKAAHGTVIRLSSLTLSRRPSPDVYLRSLARRFLLHQIAEDFSVTLNGVPLPESELMDQIEFQFPRDYNEKELPDDLIMDDDGWGIEDVANHQVKWRIMFYKTPIGIEDLRGISVYANGKLIQTPFLFNIVGGLSGQHGLEYLSGQIIADYIDEMSDDIISPERQRVRWEHPDALSLHEWGEQRIKTLLRIWKERRAQEKLRIIEEKISPFALRMAKLLPTEQKIVKQALTKIATMESLSGEQFITLSEAILTAWEGGRLQELILQLSTSEEITQEQFFSILLEANVLTALHLAESINTKLLIIQGLEQSITAKDRENAIRDYISRYPWLVSPQWETFQIEKGVTLVLKEAADTAKINSELDWNGRIDLTLSSGDQLLVLEFMRPGIQVDWDHVSRFERYVTAIKTRIRANTGGRFSRVSGYLVADKLNKQPEMLEVLTRIARDKLYAMEWRELLEQAKAQWNEFLDIVKVRAPYDERIQALSQDRKEVAAGEAANNVQII